MYILINKFISYVEYNAWNKNEWNDYEDKRVLATTGANQTHLVDQFIDYAASGF